MEAAFISRNGSATSERPGSDLSRALQGNRVSTRGSVVELLSPLHARVIPISLPRILSKMILSILGPAARGPA